MLKEKYQIENNNYQSKVKEINERTDKKIEDAIVKEAGKLLNKKIFNFISNIILLFAIVFLILVAIEFFKRGIRVNDVIGFLLFFVIWCVGGYILLLVFGFIENTILNSNKNKIRSGKVIVPVIEDIKKKRELELYNLELEHKRNLEELDLIKERIKVQTLQYENSPAILKITERFEWALFQGLSNESHQSHIKTITTSFEFTVNESGIEYEYRHKEDKFSFSPYKKENYDFVEHGINPIHDEVKLEAIAECIMLRLEKIFLDKEITGNVVKERIDYFVKMSFTIVNNNYVAPINF